MTSNGLYALSDHTILYLDHRLKAVNTSMKLSRGDVVTYLNENIGTLSKVITSHGVVGYVDYRFLTNIC